jgi:hypothetical protein
MGAMSFEEISYTNDNSVPKKRQVTLGLPIEVRFYLLIPVLGPCQPILFN